MPNLLYVDANRRIDLSDFSFLVDSPGAHSRHILENFLTNPAGVRSWVVNGFAIDNPSASQIRVTKGSAILPTKDESVTKYGYLTTEGDASRTIDISSYGNGTYGVYVRFEYQDNNIESRVFWNPSGLGSEFAQAVATRQVANWSIRIEATTPGSEWSKIGEVTKAAGPVYTIVDQRNHYFEGSVNSSYANTWGSGNDRNADRATYGIRDFQTFTAAMRTKVEELTGGAHRWWDNPEYGVLDTLKSKDLLMDFVATGLVTSTVLGLNGQISSGVAYCNGSRTVKSSVTSKTFTASKDTYIDLTRDGVFTYTEVANGAALPAKAAGAVRIACVVTDGISIILHEDMRRMGSHTDSSTLNAGGAERISADAIGPSYTMRKARGVDGQQVVNNLGDGLGSYQFAQWDSLAKNYAVTGLISGLADLTPSSTSLPTALSFWTTPNLSKIPVERFRIASKGNVFVIGSPNAVPPSWDDAFGVYSNTSLYSGVFQYSAGNADGPELSLRHSRGTVASPTVVTAGDTVGNLVYKGYTGSSWEQAALIEGLIDSSGTVSPTSMPGSLRFKTTPTGSLVPVKRLELFQDGLAQFTFPTTTVGLELNFPNGAGINFYSYATSSYDSTFYLDDNGVNWYVSDANRTIRFLPNAGSTRMVVDQYGVIQGDSVRSLPSPATTIATPAVSTRYPVGSLPTTLGQSMLVKESYWPTGTSQYLREYAYRSATGTDWQTASYLIHYQSGTTPQGFIKFSGSLVDPLLAEAHIGFGSSNSLGAVPTFLVGSSDIVHRNGTFYISGTNGGIVMAPISTPAGLTGRFFMSNDSWGSMYVYTSLHGSTSQWRRMGEVQYNVVGPVSQATMNNPAGIVVVSAQGAGTVISPTKVVVQRKYVSTLPTFSALPYVFVGANTWSNSVGTLSDWNTGASDKYFEFLPATGTGGVGAIMTSATNANCGLSGQTGAGGDATYYIHVWYNVLRWN